MLLVLLFYNNLIYKVLSGDVISANPVNYFAKPFYNNR